MQNISSLKGKTRWIESFFYVLMLFLMLYFSETPINTVRSSLLLCYNTVIPAVFPFMIISSLLLHTGAHRSISALLRRPMRFIFRCSENAVPPIILGFLCGFPIGASSAMTLYERGEISRTELKRLMLFINNPSAAFVIGAVGIGIFNSARIGRLLYLAVLIPSILIGIVSGRMLGQKREYDGSANTKLNDDSPFSIAFTRSISESAINMLNVCACVVFFSIPVGLIRDLLISGGGNSIIGALLSSFFEISGGCRAAGELTSPTVALAVCAFASSWSGLSVHLQVFSTSIKGEISLAPYVISKLIQSLISPFIALLLTKSATELAFATSINTSASPLSRVCFLILFIFSVVTAGVWHSVRRVAVGRS